MKKLVSIILAAIMLTGICVLPVSADEFLFKDEFYEYASWEGTPNYEDVLYYRELAYHYDGNSDLNWVLVQGETWYRYCDETYEVLGDRVFTVGSGYVPFVLSYGVYLAKEQRFIDITIMRTHYIYKGEYSDIYPEVLEDLEKFNLGEKIGDINGDGALDIKDATEIQRCLAEYRDYPENDPVGAAEYYTTGSETLQYKSDINRDGKRNIRDVTSLQRKLAEYDEVTA